MPARLRVDSDQWSIDGEKITTRDVLSEVERVFADEGPVILEHRFYRGGTGPAHIVIDDFDDLCDYLETRTSGGDAIRIWSLDRVCRDDNQLAAGKVPDLDGAVPVGGAY